MNKQIRFTLGFAGAFYVLMTTSLAIHEVFGHGLAWALVGARRIEVSIGPGFAGWARGDHVPGPAATWFITLAGIGVNGLVGLAALGAFRWRRPGLTPGGLALFWVATTELGQAVGYTLQGLVFDQGDAAHIPLGRGRFVAVAVLGVAFLALARWSVSRIAIFIRDHFEAADLASFRRAFVRSFSLPFAVIIVAAPGVPDRSWATILAFDAGVLAVLVGTTLVFARRLPPESERHGHPITCGEAASWVAAAAAVFALTYLRLERGFVIAL